MRGHDRHLEPLTATEALAHCLIALGLPAVDIPYGLDERAALYRTLLATRPVLVILDDATVNLVRDLLPPSNCGSAVVVTCRHRMPELTAGYRAGEVVLDVLDEAAAVELLGGLIGADRVARERDGAASLARGCGNLPLALRVGAAYAAGRPDVPLARLAADIGGELRGPVDQAFDLSYQRLPPGQQRVFRLIGMIPGADFTTVAVAALAGCTSAEAEEGLNALVKANLILEYASHRYRMHDLVKLYAVARAAADDTPAEREAALLRLFHWYWQIIEQTSQAHRIQLPGIHRGPVVPKPRQPSLAGIGMNAPDVGWLDAELTNICASIKLASELGLSPIGWQLADAMLGYIRIHPGGNDWAAAVRSARGAAAKSNDHHGHAVMLLNVADAEYREGRQDTEQRYARQALEVSRKAHWPTGEALAYGTLGRSYWSTGSISLSAYYLRSALRIHQKTGDEAGQATIIGRIARNAYDLGQLRDAADGYERALELAHRIDSKFGQMRAPAYIALVLRDLGRYEEADRWCGLSIRLSEEAGFAEGLAIGLSCRAAIFNDTSAPDRAVKTARAARVVIPYLADYRIEVDCLVRLGEVEASAGDPARAMRSFDQALQIASQVTYRQGMARAHADRAAEQVRLGQYEEAIASCLSARAAMRHCDLLLVRAQLAVTEADIALAAGRCADAVAGYRQASAIYHCAGHRLAEVRTLLSWGHAAAMVPGYGRPGRSWRRALHIAGQMDVPEADIVRGLLGAPG
jgi:tetratricopeptide (TPR) repeat protein